MAQRYIAFLAKTHRKLQNIIRDARHLLETRDKHTSRRTEAIYFSGIACHRVTDGNSFRSSSGQVASQNGAKKLVRFSRPDCVISVGCVQFHHVLSVQGGACGGGRNHRVLLRHSCEICLRKERSKIYASLRILTVVSDESSEDISKEYNELVAFGRGRVPPVDRAKPSFP